jgi:hypothetical protein
MIKANLQQRALQTHHPPLDTQTLLRALSRARMPLRSAPFFNGLTAGESIRWSSMLNIW